MQRFGPATHKFHGSEARAGSSSGSNEELHPEKSYGTDLRYLDREEKETADRAGTANTAQQERVKKFMSSARAAGKYRQNALIDEPSIRGRVPRSEASIKGVVLPSTGDKIGTAGGINYPTKPASRAGKFVGF